MTDVLLEQEAPVTTVSAGDDDVRQYLQEIRRYPLLSPQQEFNLARRCAQGDEDAIRQMVNCNLRLVVSVARDYSGRGMPMLDLIQEGSIGLIVAAQKFDYTRDVRFSTYATKWIRQRITRSLTDQNGLIRVPAHTAERMRKLIFEQAAFIQNMGREPTAAELAQCTGLTEQKTRQLLKLIPQTCSLDAPVGEDGTIGAILPVGEGLEPQAELIRQELKGILDELLDKLTDRQRQILRLRFGMEDGVCYSLEEIGKVLGISKERVRQVERQAMDRLHKMGANLGLEDFLNE